MADGGLVFSFDVPETTIQQMAQLVAAKNAGIVLNVVCTAYGFSKKQSEKEVLSLEQRLEKTQRAIDEKEADLEVTE